MCVRALKHYAMLAIVIAFLLCVAPSSGIVGQIFVGPTCPVERLDSPCPDRTYRGTIEILDLDRHEVARVRADENGRFQFALKPGAYILHPLSPNIMPRGIEQTVSVEPDTYTTVRVEYDSGIR
jgi:hypothetical protein